MTTKAASRRAAPVATLCEILSAHDTASPPPIGSTPSTIGHHLRSTDSGDCPRDVWVMCMEVASVVASFEDTNPLLCGEYFPLLVDLADRSTELVVSAISARWKAATVAGDFSRDKLVDIFGCGGASLFPVCRLSSARRICVAFVDKADVAWVAHRYGVPLAKAPRRMMRIVGGLGCLDVPYVFRDLLVQKTGRTDECACCLASSDASRLCAGCESAAYCSVECQSAHWADHRRKCRALRTASEGQVRREVRTDYFCFLDAFAGQAGETDPVTLYVR